MHDLVRAVSHAGLLLTLHAQVTALLHSACARAAQKPSTVARLGPLGLDPWGLFDVAGAGAGAGGPSVPAAQPPADETMSPAASAASTRRRTTPMTRLLISR